MKKIALSVIAAVFATSAFATDSTTFQAVNQGNISNTVGTSASVTGVGTSYSSATGTAGAFSNATAGAVPGSVAISGTQSSYVTGTAFNYATGAGTGSAYSTGHADTYGSARAGYAAPGQSVSVNSSASTVANGFVTAGTNQAGFFNAGNENLFTGDGKVGATWSADHKSVTVNGSVVDTKTSTSWSNAGELLINGLPVNTILEKAPSGAGASSTVSVSGAFSDPSGK